MIAYNGSKESKAAILKELRAHAKADELIKGQYWEDGKGCAVGCTIKGSDHSKYEPLFGIPQALAHLEDCIFEGLPNARAKKWPIQFMSAISVGADLSRVQWQFLYWLLTDEVVNPGISNPLVKSAVAQCADVVWGLAQGKPVDVLAAELAAESAVLAAVSAKYSAKYSAELAAVSARLAAVSARSAAVSAELAARSAAVSAELAARSAAVLAAELAAESAVLAAARSAAYALMADKLLSLLKAASEAKS